LVCSFPLPSRAANTYPRIGEKFLEWSDESPPLDTILTNVSLYWFTQGTTSSPLCTPANTASGFPTSIYPYRALFSPSRKPFPYIEKPTGYSFFPYELFPGLKSNVEKNVNVVHYKQHERGGHFAALERPKELLGDVEEFVEQVWKEGSAKL
jgi:microsomal epoxide hydrolase